MKKICQFHFTSWPDFGVPLNAGPLLKFLRRVRQHHKYSNPKPLLIHCRFVALNKCLNLLFACVVCRCDYLSSNLLLCSAGVGRTGTLIGMDVEMQRAEKEKVVDPYNFVLSMRNERNLMVQTEVCNMYIQGFITWK